MRFETLLRWLSVTAALVPVTLAWQPAIPRLATVVLRRPRFATSLGVSSAWNYDQEWRREQQQQPEEQPQRVRREKTTAVEQQQQQPPSQPEVVAPLPTAAAAADATAAASPDSKSFSSPVQTFESVEDYLRALETNERQGGELLVVMYFASYCKICQRASMTYKQVAGEYANDDFRFTRLEASSLPASTLRELGLTKFPFVQVFRSGDCVASFSTGPSHLFRPKVRATLDDCRKRSHEDWRRIAEAFAGEIAENRAARDRLARRASQ